MFDIAVIGITVLSGLISFWTGIVRIILGLLAWAGAFFFTIYLFKYLRPIVGQQINVGAIADATTAVILFVFSLVILTLISHNIDRRIRISRLSLLDRSFGLVAGLVIGFGLVTIGYMGVSKFFNISDQKSTQPHWMQGSKSRPLIEWSTRFLFQLIPDNWSISPLNNKNQTNTTQQRFEKFLEPQIRKPLKRNKDGYSDKARKDMDRVINQLKNPHNETN
ncbi:MAG: CvpA family protein [Pseudomonadota bacterium]|nr:CvpA family protein [Pseudomonadota bacterium]